VRSALRLCIVAAVILFAMALGTEAQQARKTPLIGLLDYSAPDAARVNWWNAFRQALQKLGYVEGQGVAFEARWAQGRVDRLPGLAAELVRLRVDIIVTGGGETALAAKQATGYDPHRHGDRRGPGKARGCREPRSTGR
jgi:ABC-type uncharacterized transport system substrate-binding protein